MLSDLEIAQAAKLRPILDIAKQVGLSESALEPFGWYKAKVHLDVITVSRTSPTPSTLT